MPVSRLRISPLVAVFLTVFFDMMSFGTVIPDLQLRAEALGAKGFLAGLVLATFSIAQFVVAPLLGRWSDRVGRRRVLVLTCSLATCASLAYGFATTLAIVFLSRALLGFAGANIGVAYAYISDSTKPEDRAAAMGKIGMAFGFGFMFGPPLGATMVKLGNGSPLLLGLTSALFAFVNLMFVLFFMPDAPPQPAEPEHLRKLSPLAKLGKALATPGLSFLLALFLVANLAFSNLESTYFLLAHDVYRIDALATSLILVFVGVVAAIVQGGLLGRLVARFGETALLRTGYFLQAPVLATIPFVSPWAPVLLGCLVLGIGSGIANPSLSSLISQAAPASLVGGIFGITQSLGAIARIVGPVIGNMLYAQAPWMPYALAATMMIVPVLMAASIHAKGRDAQVEAATSG
ncbi:MAG: MFS transporter [Fimbriimonadaceae bacterium]|nr:MFS transporter [Chthonomonadaceae bacterium]MCO5297534.1 MFS transporter [Fimbriimonadaceae bacterium]